MYNLILAYEEIIFVFFKSIYGKLIQNVINVHLADTYLEIGEIITCFRIIMSLCFQSIFTLYIFKFFNL